ncbi:Twin-arginine translocation protein TatB [Castellaniella defragrans 65Phen]|uniref:Sec-independent protein translocase protein TatB n=3 Tax=Castellaniella defragrans TaxID=75697 RepID=W8WSR4_CASD6|nr:Sec-independent protein translocase protein TatB [Castellaniella defragrans]MBB6084030.1 sec-independent protein translocase protein TatB [Castellaniella defragrans]CDM22564.1 Twin-arginine translocation protein TatB [Castellaniella defragrans 65Phen]
MFDVSFSELMLIGVIALIVIGPERLPKVARTVGHLLGRAQRYVNEVKSDIQKEMDLKEIGDIKHQMEDAARSVQSSMTSSVDELRAAVTQPSQALKDTLDQARQALDTRPASADAPASGAAPAEPAASAPAIPAPAAERSPEPASAPRSAPASTDTSH